MKRNLFLFLAAATVFFSGCATDYEVLNSVEAIILTTDSSVKIIGNPITFTVTDSDGDVLTDEATIYVDGVPINGATFTSDAVDTFEVKAEYLGVASQPVTISFHDGSQVNFAKRVLIEDYTGTWCGYCPRVAHGIEMVKSLTDYVVPVAIHRASSSESNPNYDPYNYDSSQLEDIISIPGYPKGMLNRMTQWSFPEPNNVNQVVNLTQGENPKLGLAMTSAVTGSNITLDVNIKYSKNFSNLKLVVYVLENGLIHEQHNYTNYYNSEDLIGSFEHNHVLRSCLTPLLGEAISDSEATSGNVYTRTFTVAVPDNVANAGNIEFVAFVIDGNGNAINVRKAGRNEEQAFEEL